MSSIVAQRAQLRAEAQRRQAETLPKLKAVLAHARHQRGQRLKSAQIKCALESAQVRREVDAARAALRAWSLATRDRARDACRLLKANIREDALEEIDDALAAIEAQRSQIQTLRRRAAGMRDSRGQAGGRRAAEIRAEREDEVRRDIGDDALMLAAFERVKRRLRTSKRRTMLEAFYEYLSDHPEVLGEVTAELEGRWAAEAERMLTELEEVPGDDGDLQDYLSELDEADRHLLETPGLAYAAAPF